MRHAARVVVIGIGNVWRGDDGIGWEVVEAAQPHLRRWDAVEVVLTDGEPMRLVEHWRHASTSIVVDAVRTGEAPGTVHVLDAAAVLDGGRDRRDPSSHAAGLACAVRLADATGLLPGELIVVGVEAGPCRHGRGLSPGAAGAVDLGADTVVHLVAAAAGPPPTRDLRSPRHTAT